VQSDYERSSGDYDSSGGDHGGSDRNSKVIMVSVVEIGAIMRIAMTVAVIAIIMLKS
jgi:hypothetical protein